MKKVRVTKEQAAVLVKEGTKTLIAAVLTSLLIGGVIGYFIGVGKMPEVSKSQPCEWVKCNCNSGYDYHCANHGDGHSCYDNIAIVD